MRICDWIADFIWRAGVDTVFGVTGGGNVYLTDGVRCNPKLKFVAMHGELGAAYAAKGYAHYRSRLGVCMVSTGCGSTNTITGLLAAYQDNVPLMVIAGEVYSHQYYTWARQSGTQSANIRALVSPIVKHFYRVSNAHNLPKEMERCLRLSGCGRPGPVWIEVPLNLQSAVMV